MNIHDIKISIKRYSLDGRHTSIWIVRSSASVFYLISFISKKHFPEKLPKESLNLNRVFVSKRDDLWAWNELTSLDNCHCCSLLVVREDRSNSTTTYYGEEGFHGMNDKWSIEVNNRYHFRWYDQHQVQFGSKVCDPFFLSNQIYRLFVDWSHTDHFQSYMWNLSCEKQKVINDKKHQFT